MAFAPHATPSRFYRRTPNDSSRPQLKPHRAAPEREPESRDFPKFRRQPARFRFRPHGSAFANRKRVTRARRDLSRRAHFAHANRIQGVARGAVSQLAAAVLAPRPHFSIFCECDRKRRAARDFGHIFKARNARWNRAVLRRAIAELSETIRAHRPHAAVAFAKQRKGTTSRHARNAAKSRDGRWNRRSRRAFAALPDGNAAPRFDGSARLNPQRKQIARRDFRGGARRTQQHQQRETTREMAKEKHSFHNGSKMSK